MRSPFAREKSSQSGHIRGVPQARLIETWKDIGNHSTRSEVLILQSAF